MNCVDVPATSAEVALALACARIELDDASRWRMLELLDKPLDWPRVLAYAGYHGLRPLLHRHLSSLPEASVPRPVLVDLWGGYEIGRRRNREAARELARIVGLFAAHDIPAVPYKGPLLATTVYGDLGLREFRDLDILLQSADIVRAAALLEENGYRPAYELAPAAADALLRSGGGHEVQLRKPPHLVELQWRTDANFPVERSDPGWWRELPRVELEGIAMASFDPTDLLLVLCIHGAKHRWEALGWLVDIAELLRREPSIGWDAIMERARSLGVERRLYLGLALASDLLGAPLPPQVRQRCERSGVAPLAAQILTEILGMPRMPDGAFRRMRDELELYDHSSHRLKHVMRTIFAPSMADWARWPLPRALHFLYVPLRLARLAGKHLLKLRFPRNRAGATPRTPPPQPHSTG